MLKRNVFARTSYINDELYVSNGNKVFKLNQLGITIWKFINEKKNINEIRESIYKEYPCVPTEELDTDIDNFIDNLVSVKILLRE